MYIPYKHYTLCKLNYHISLLFIIHYNNREIDIALSEPYPCVGVGIGSKYLRYIGTYLIYIQVLIERKR